MTQPNRWSITDGFDEIWTALFKAFRHPNRIMKLSISDGFESRKFVFTLESATTDYGGTLIIGVTPDFLTVNIHLLADETIVEHLPQLEGD